MRYGIKITGSIKVKEILTKTGYKMFSTLLASNSDYKTKDKLYLNSIVNFKEREYREKINDGDIIEIIGSLTLQKNYKDASRVDVNLFVEKVLGINNTDNSMFENDESDDYLDIKEGDLPF